MRVAPIFVFCLLGTTLAGQNTLPTHPAWAIPTYRVEGIASKAFSRFSASAEIGDRHVRNLRLTGAFINSEGNKFSQVSLGTPLMLKQFSPLKPTRGKKEVDEEFFTEPFLGVAFTNHGHRATFGQRTLYFSKNWFIESVVSRYRGGEAGWTNCEPLADVMRHIGKGFYVGGVSSCYVGPHHGEKEEPPGRITEFFTGPGFLYQRGRWDIGASYEVGLGKAKNYIALFGSLSF